MSHTKDPRVPVSCACGSKKYLKWEAVGKELPSASLLREKPFEAMASMHPKP